ncbi:protein WVD2-like 7 isoform X1 [Cucumis melo var. makuwa]|uniref:Protein WVD2-like 7 isoform X1 n=1 Tax=Cucumis melo var. makuwa TaxID=1194695 RepID=A0A5A7T2E2_CUCMM|nr:protein WVD2-like 7 isoform X1 [Cucumis melo var. makuwa]TYK22779.1 protein WVD2-like 7 isoform X1 [Cucumis melo var. makuwa]
MADSTCLMHHPFSYTSGFPNESMEGNNLPIHALSQSVSFGRFMSESLSWEKWSTFSHNRYVEEAEKFSRPGSVAQKKAFFEAHYKKIAAQRAAALLEQENAASSSKSLEQTETKQNGSASPQTSMSTSNGVQQYGVEVVTGQDFVTIANGNGSSDGSLLKEEKLDSREVEGGDSGLAHQVIEEITQKVVGVDLNDGLTGNEFNRTPQMEISLPKSSRQNWEQPSTISKKKAATSSSKLLLFDRSSKILPSTPVKPISPASCLNNATPKQVANKYSMESADKRKSNIATPKRVANKSVMESADKRKSNIATPKQAANKYVMESADKRKSNIATPKQVVNKCVTESADKRKSTPKSLRMAVNFTPIRELNKLTSTVMRKIERSRVGASTSKPAKDCSTPLRTPNTAMKNESQKHPSATPWSEKKRNKLYSPFSFTPFSLRTDERAARRKEKLEEKFNTNESQKKVQLQTKLKEKAETEITKLRQSFCFKARPLPNFYKERKAQKNEEVLKCHPPSPKLGRKGSPKIGEATMPHSGHMAPVKSTRGTNKNAQGKTRSLSLQTLMSAHENTSPNIQH